ncbi:hypothetical protein H4R33_004478 [Dimargaris cristalligena]|uniref:Uncharacterized protein n=1 Tax=Dimargaris cristalligena TaxID=215637 RepID=A0A4P9ZY00_9FUNG|nr:hypothetical protein H4R33_004478 [Dimargaris cristalligena]RKP37792.1 hypothetical protein BJ085DRAFT_33291 [Dimargaris cristalligena]|eukprot:RKP37792.1 hypothetical protein BJ085DRAFT_33291 [Dimargaris cristalligena]
MKLLHATLFIGVLWFDSILGLPMNPSPTASSLPDSPTTNLSGEPDNIPQIDIYWSRTYTLPDLEPVERVRDRACELLNDAAEGLQECVFRYVEWLLVGPHDSPSNSPEEVVDQEHEEENERVEAEEGRNESANREN